jgi:hypothetical protein
MGLLGSVAGMQAKRAASAMRDGHRVHVVQIRGSVSHTAKLSRPIDGAAEQIEAIEAEGWRLDHFSAVPYRRNMTLTCLFRPAPPQRPGTAAQYAQQSYRQA